LREPLRVCIITPGHLSTNPRVCKEATALSAAGYRVAIICGRFIPEAIELDRQIVDPSWVVHGVAFGRRAAPRVVHLRQRAIQAAARAAMQAGLATPAIETSAHHPVGPDLAAAACAVRADLYIAHYVAALPAAAKAARLHQVRYAFDAEDFHLGDLPDHPKHAFEKRLIHAIERRWLPGAAYVTAAAPLIAEAYAQTYGISRPTVVLNTFPRSQAPFASTQAGTARPGPSVYWFSQTIGPGRGLETALEAVAVAQSMPHLYLRGTHACGYRESLEDRARQLGVADRLHFLDPVAPGELERSGAAYDIGYVGETGETRNRAMALTNKLFSYLSSGIPITASDIPAHVDLAPLLADVMSIHPIGDARQLAAQFDMLLKDRNSLATARACAWSLGQGPYSWEIQAPNLLRTLEHNVGPLIGNSGK
jgi:glycosyltransferase involved in cell wall biosynthesis